MNSIARASVESKAEQSRLDRRTSRLVTYEDGVPRLVTVTARQWRQYDAMVAAGWAARDLLWIPFYTAHDMIALGHASDLEEELPRSVRTWAYSLWYLADGRNKRMPANEY